MLKQAFRSYLTTLHPRSRRKRKVESKDFIRTFIIVWIFWWVFSDVTIFWLIIRATPLFLIQWTNLGIGTYMGKAMLLCPMRQETRKKYINYMIGLKIGCPVVLGFLLEFIWSMVYGFDICRSFVLLISYISYGIAENIHIHCIDKMDNRVLKAKKDTEGNVKWSWLNFSVSFVVLFMVINYGLTEIEGIQGQFYKITTLIGSVYLMIMDTVIFCTQYKDMLDEVTDYELAFYIPGRLHYVKNE